MAKSIEVYLNGSWEELPKCHYTVTPQKVETKHTMRDGRIVKDFRGIRLTLSAPVGYLPLALFQALNGAIEAGDFVDVKYHDLDGTQVEAAFDFEPIERKAFKYVSGVPTWTVGTLKATAQEVL